MLLTYNAQAKDLESVVIDFKKDLEASLEQNQYVNNYVCGVSGCSFDLVTNDMTIGNFSFKDEINQINGAQKTTISLSNLLNNSSSMSYVVCLSDDSCKFFPTEDKLGADYSYENNKFANKREKRNIRELGKWFGASAVGAWVGSRFDQMNSDIGTGSQAIWNHYQNHISGGRGISHNGGGSW